MAYTIRLSDEEEETLSKIKQKFGLKTSNKAFIKLLNEYLPLVESLNDMSNKYQDKCEEYDDLRFAVMESNSAKKRLDELINQSK